MPERELDSRFRYHGPTTGVTLRLAGNVEREVMFHDGKEYSLPSDHRFIKRLVAQEILEPIGAPAAEVPTAPPASSPRTTRGSAKSAAAAATSTKETQS